jgi:putative DNA primase/helicase
MKMEELINDSTIKNPSPENIAQEVEAIIQKENKQYDNTVTGALSTSATNDILKALKNNEDGDAWLLVNLQRNKFCFDHSLGKWFRWCGHYWEEDAIDHVYSALDDVVEEYSKEYDRQSWIRKKAAVQQNKDEERKASEFQKELLKRIYDLQGVRRKKDILFLAARGENSLGISGDEWDRSPFLLGCSNGVINLETGEFSNGRPEDYVRTIAPTEWKGIDEPAPAWKKFLKDIFEDNPELVPYSQRFLGYAISGSVRDHVIAVFWGAKGRNGKGTLFETVKYVLGSIAEPINVEMLTGDYKNRSSAAPSPDIMSLRGKRLVWASEAEEGHQFAVGKIKLLTGADTLTGRPPFGKNNITFSPTHKIVLLTNNRPKLTSLDSAFLERLHLIPLNLFFTDNPTEDFHRKRDPILPEKLKVEASGILAWLVRGFLEWNAEGLKPPKIVLETTAQYKKEEDTIGQFLSDRTKEDPKCSVRAQILYNNYKLWCEECGYKYVSITKFGERITELYNKHSDGRTNIYDGLSLIVYTEETLSTLKDGGTDYV